MLSDEFKSCIYHKYVHYDYLPIVVIDYFSEDDKRLIGLDKELCMINDVNCIGKNLREVGKTLEEELKKDSTILDFEGFKVKINQKSLIEYTKEAKKYYKNN